MEKTTVYLPRELKRAIRRVATHRGVSEAEVIRDAIRSSIGAAQPRPRGGLYDSGGSIADAADRYLEGFGER